MKPISYSSHISSEDLQRRFEEIQTLLAQAFRANQLLQQQVKVQDLAIQAMTPSVNSAAAEAGAFLDRLSFNYAGGTDRVTHHVYSAGTAYANNVLVDDATGLLSLRPTTRLNRVPLVTDPDTGKQVLSELASVEVITIGNSGRSDLIDPVAHWLLEPDSYWCTSASVPELQITISLPPAITSEINFIKIENLFPYGIQHQITWVDIHGNYHTEPTHSRSWLYHVNGQAFGGQIQVHLTSNLMINGSYVFGLRNIALEHRRYSANGYAISSVNLNHTSGNNLDLRSFIPSYTLPSQPSQISEVIQFQVGTTFNGTDIGNIIYDSTIDPFPFQNTDPAITVTGAPSTLYVKTQLWLSNGTPFVEGFYMEYNSN